MPSHEVGYYHIYNRCVRGGFLLAGVAMRSEVPYNRKKQQSLLDCPRPRRRYNENPGHKRTTFRGQIGACSCVVVAWNVSFTGLLMKKLAVESALRWVLAAWTLAVSVFAPTTVVHRHSGGSILTSTIVSIRLPKQHCTRSSHWITARAPNSDLFIGYGLTQAPRFLLPGTVKYVPVPSESNSPNGKSPGGWETIATTCPPGAYGRLRRVLGRTISNWSQWPTFAWVVYLYTNTKRFLPPVMPAVLSCVTVRAMSAQAFS